MKKQEYKVVVPESVRDLVQRLGLEYHQKRKVIAGLIEDHQFDETAGFLQTPFFTSYEKKMAEALLAFETAHNEMVATYIPQEVVGKQYRWTLDYHSCELTFQVVE